MANRFSIDVNTNPIQPSGLLVERNTFQAINDMQEKIKNLLQQRTLMLAAISHDLRTPLARLRLRFDCAEASPQDLKNHQDLDEMEEMISQILIFAKDDYLSEQKTHLDLTSLVISLCNDFIDQGYSVQYKGTEQRIIYRGSALSLQRAFSNLIENAVKYAGSAEINLYFHQTIQIVISDHGNGINAEHIDKIFMPFYRGTSANSHTKGSGLGLTIAQNIIHAHNGTISLQQADPTGLKIIITLPPIANSP